MKAFCLMMTAAVCAVLIVGMLLLGRSMHRDSLEERVLLIQAEMRAVERAYEYGTYDRHSELHGLWGDYAAVFRALGNRDRAKWAEDVQARESASRDRARAK